MSDLHEKFHPRNRRWPSGMPESIKNTTSTPVGIVIREGDLVSVSCPHHDDRNCEFNVRVHKQAAEFTLKQHLAVSCPLRANGTPGFEEAKEAKLNGRHEELVPIAPPADDEPDLVGNDAFGLKQYPSGMTRTDNEGKVNWALAFDGPLLERLATHLSKAAPKHGKRNWMNANSEEDYERFRESAVRHFMQYLNGETDEDHFAATVFNLNGMEYVRGKLAG